MGEKRDGGRKGEGGRDEGRREGGMEEGGREGWRKEGGREGWRKEGGREEFKGGREMEHHLLLAYAGTSVMVGR